MQYMALLYGDESAAAQPGDPAFEAEMAAYAAFDEKHGHAVRGGEALQPSATMTTLRNGDGGPLVTDGPYAESSEVIGGYYVLEAEDLDQAIAIAADLPAAKDGAVELRPVAQYYEARPADAPAAATGQDRYVAFVRDKEGPASIPGTPEWDEGAAAHGRFAEAAGTAVWGGCALHPISTATTVRSRDGEVLVTDGPFAEWAEAVGGFYVFAPTDRARAVELAGTIPTDAVELVPVMEVG
jgi:hypothetical protein